MGSAAWGTPMPIDPGSYRIHASAPGKEPWSTSIDIPSVVPAVPEPPQRDAPTAGGHTMAWLLAGAGVAAFGAGGYFALRSNSETDAARGLCVGGLEGNVCNRDENLPGFDGGERERNQMYDHRDNAKHAALVSYIGFAGGAALIGSVLLFCSSSRDRTGQRQSPSKHLFSSTRF